MQAILWLTYWATFPLITFHMQDRLLFFDDESCPLVAEKKKGKGRRKTVEL